jgi:hypothetical protein
MANRIIKSYSRGSSVQLTDALSSLLALEMLSPSPVLYVLSPWLSDMPLINNQFGQLRAIIADAGRENLGLAAVLTMLAGRGTLVRVLYRSGHVPTEEFVRRLPKEVERQAVDTLHEKGLVCHHFYLRGSMNFTYSGVNINDETVEITTEPSQVALALAEAQQRWELVTDDNNSL